MKVTAATTASLDAVEEPHGIAPLDNVGDSVSFTPSGFRLPIMKITMSKSDGSESQTIYACDQTEEADCLVDLASQTALDAIATKAASKAIPDGTYDKLSLSTCKDGKSGSEATTAYVKGSTTFKGATWRTDASATNGIDNSGTGSTAETQVGNWSCATKNVILNPALTVNSSTDVKLTVMVDNTFGASFGVNVSPGRGGCKAPTGGGNGVCVEYPALLPYVGNGTATMKRFKIAHHISATGSIVDNKANALIIVATADAKPLMAFGRILYTSSSALISNNTAPQDTTYGGPNYITETNYSTFTVNADSSIAFKQGGSADTYAAAFSAFSLSDHTGDVKTRDDTVTWKYHAIPLE